MTRQEAQDYRKRARRMIYQEGVDKFLDRIDEEVIRRMIMCDDYRRRSARQVIQLHEKPGEKMYPGYVHKWCGKKVV